MKLRRLIHLIGMNLRTSRFRTALAVVGIVVGTALLTFFLGLGQGLRERVLNRIFPVNQLELEPRAVQFFGVQQAVGQTPLDATRVAQIGKIPGVERAFGKRKSAFPARLWGGKELLGYNLFTEAFFDGVPAEVIRAELESFENTGEGVGSEGGLTARRSGQAANAAPATETPSRCDVDMDCPAGAVCDDALCQRVVWSARWVARPHVVLPCGDAGDCHGDRCEEGRCAAAGGSAFARCMLDKPAGNGRDLDFESERGFVAAPCADAGGWCKTPQPCPERQYCAADNPDATTGWCEDPLPAVINPLLLEVFNSDMARSLGAAPVGSLAVLYGIRFHVAFGDSFFTQDAARTKQAYKQAQVVGFSRKAPELGVSLPLSIVQHWNGRLRGEDPAGAFDAVLVETAGNEAVPRVIAAAEDLGFSLSRKSRAARTAGAVIFFTALGLVLLALVVLAVAAVQIAQTFAMLVHERRKEIAILRALGATGVEVSVLVLGEAAVLGLAGGVAGVVLAWLAAAAVDAAAQQWLANVPFLPSGFFVFPLWSAPLAVGVSLLCCVLGAALPARRASRLDPARVLAEA